MEKFIKKYIKDVRKCITLNSKEEKDFIKTFSKELNIAYDNKEFNDIHELNEVYGLPNEIAASYILTIKTERINHYLRIKFIVLCLIVVITTSIISIYTYDSYRLNKLLNEIQEEKDAKEGIWADEEG